MIEHAAVVIELSSIAAQYGNKNAVSDAGVAVLLSKSSAQSALVNILINIKIIEDEKFIRDVEEKTEAAMLKIDSCFEDVMKTVYDRIGVEKWPYKLFR